MQEVSGSIPLSSTKPLPTVCTEKTNSRCGGIAQLGERLHGMQEVSGSIPLISTNSLFVQNKRIQNPIIILPFAQCDVAFADWLRAMALTCSAFPC